MTRPTLLPAAALLGALSLLAGCGASPAKPATPTAARLLSGATNSALGTSFRASLEGSARLTLTGVSGLPASGNSALSRLETELNSAQLQASLEFQSPTVYQLSLALAPLLSAPVEVVGVDGARYLKVGGGSWYQIPSGSGIGPGSGSATGLGGELRRLAAAGKVTDLGTTVVDGTKVEHLRTAVSATALERLLGTLSGRLGGGGYSLPGGGSGLAGLVSFGNAQLDSYVATASRLPVRQALSASASFNLGALALLEPGQDAGVRGSATLTVGLTVDYSDFGASFEIQRPAPVTAGVPSLGSLQGLLS